MRKRTAIAIAVTALLFAAHLFPLPPIQDAVTGAVPENISLRIPFWHLATAFFSSLADLITINSARQDTVLVVYLILAFWAAKAAGWKKRPPVWSDLGDYIVYLAAVLAFLTWAMLLPRPSARLEISPPGDQIVIDFHSHTSRSWDGRRVLGAFTPERNIQRHAKLGFQAGFITDHNNFEGGREGMELTRENWKEYGYRSLSGEEVSLHDTHIAVLGNHERIDNTNYSGDLSGVFRFLKEEPKRYGGLTVMSLPEYWKGHPQSRWEEFAAAGAAGFEILNSAPKALDFPEKLRKEVVELCRKRNKFVAGVTDTHGWGSATAAWSVMRIPEYQSMNADQLERAVMKTLRHDGFNAVQVIRRVKQEPLPAPWIAADPFLSLWTLFRIFNWAQTLVFAGWLWLIAWIAPR